MASQEALTRIGVESTSLTRGFPPHCVVQVLRWPVVRVPGSGTDELTGADGALDTHGTRIRSHESVDTDRGIRRFGTTGRVGRVLDRPRGDGIELWVVFSSEE